MLNENFAYLAAVISTIGGLRYFFLTFQGKVKPNKVTWFLWGIIPMIILFFQLREGVGVQVLLTFSVGIIPLMIFFFSFVNKNAYWKLGRLDIISGVVAVIAIILWILIRDGNIALILAVTANAIAGVPTLIKSIKYPETENPIYILTAVAAIITLLTIDEWNIANVLFPFYLLIMPSLITFFVVSKIGKKFTN